MSADEPRPPEDPVGGPGKGARDEGPIEELQLLAYAPDEGFVARLRASLQRRFLAGDLADLAWTTPLVVLREFLEMIVTMVSPTPPKGDSG